MTPILPNPFKKEKTLAELEEEDERLNTELSVSQKKYAIARLKEKGLKPSHFGGDWKRIMNFLFKK